LKTRSLNYLEVSLGGRYSYLQYYFLETLVVNYNSVQSCLLAIIMLGIREDN